jgi:uncharacterized membrane protein YccC
MPAREIRFKVPRIPPGLFSNLLGLAGLIAVAVAVGGLTGNWWWTAVAGGVFAVGLSWLASTDEPAAAVTADATVHPIGAARSA